MNLDGLLSAKVTDHEEEGEKRRQEENMGKDRKRRGRERGKEGKKEGKKLVNLIIKDYAHGNALISLHNRA